jgi:hypothetical protein
MPIFTLWLQNRTLASSSNYGLIKPVSVNDGQTITTFNINFDEIFKGENYKYKKCRIRMQASNTTNDTATFANSLSYVGCSISSNYNDTKLITPTLFNVTSLVDTPVTSSRLTFAPTTDTANSKGCNINMPFGSQFLIISFGDADNLTDALALESSYNLNYEMLLFFELYDEI